MRLIVGLVCSHCRTPHRTGVLNHIEMNGIADAFVENGIGRNYSLLCDCVTESMRSFESLVRSHEKKNHRFQR